MPEITLSNAEKRFGEIEQRHAKCDQGEWRICQAYGDYNTLIPMDKLVTMPDVSGSEPLTPEDAEFIKHTHDYDTKDILAFARMLMAEVEKITKDRNHWREARRETWDTANVLKDENDTLKARVAELEDEVDMWKRYYNEKADALKMAEAAEKKLFKDNTHAAEAARKENER